MPRYIKIGTIVILCIVSFVLGLLVRDIPNISLDRQVGISDLANLFLTIIVGFLIPITLSPWVTDRRNIKDFLIDELKEAIAFLAVIKALIDDAAVKGLVSPDETLRVNSMISQDLGMKISSLQDQLKLSFDGKSEKLSKEIWETYVAYWQEVTGGALRSQSFKFDISFRMFHDKNYAKLEKCFKKSVHLVNGY